VSKLYIANLAPIGRHIDVVDRTDGNICEYFDEYCFALARRHPERVKFLIDHDPGRAAGRFSSLIVHRGWLTGAFQLEDNEHGRAAAKLLRVGSPISVGFDPELSPELGSSGTLHRQVAKLNEASLVDRAAYPGAAVVSVLGPAKRTALTSDAARESSPAATGYSDRLVAAGEISPEADIERRLLEERIAERARDGILFRPAIGSVLGVR
jgi:phage head maturation protease